jgi:hypothetical protein
MSDEQLQRTDEWRTARAGKFTGSRFADVLARNKKTGDKLKAWHDLVWQIVVERMTGEAVDGPVGFALQWGTDVEPYAREAYELETGLSVVESGFLLHPEYPFVGCSPDGLIGEDGGLEMKCPKSSAVHLERFISGVPDEYKPQLQGCMWVTGRAWWDFVSFDPRMPESHRLLRIRVERDEKYISELEAAVLEAEQAAQELMARLSKIAA